MRLGFIARILAVFRVENLTLYKDTPEAGGREAELVSTLLRYVATPQYLRKRAFPLSPILQYAGILPPLRTPNHQLNSKIEELLPVSYREGIVLSTSGHECSVDVGLSNPLTIKANAKRPGEILTLRVKRNGTLTGEAVSSEDIPHYFGIRRISATESLSKALDGNFDLRIATSRLAEPLTRVANNLRKSLHASTYTLMLYGSPYEGLYEIAEREGFDLSRRVDYTVNTVPDQGTATVRTEEALNATLAILNYMMQEGS